MEFGRFLSVTDLAWVEVTCKVCESNKAIEREASNVYLSPRSWFWLGVIFWTSLIELTKLMQWNSLCCHPWGTLIRRRWWGLCGLNAFRCPNSAVSCSHWAQLSQPFFALLEGIPEFEVLQKISSLEFIYHHMWDKEYIRSPWRLGVRYTARWPGSLWNLSQLCH